MSKKFFEKQKHDIDHWRSHDDEAQNQREHIAEIIIFFNVVFVLQCEFVEIMWECQTALQCYKVREQHQHIDIQWIDETKLQNVKKNMKQNR